jgi:hypothetical protein
MDNLVIVIKPAKLGLGGQRYEARLGDELLCTAREPFGAAARILEARGIPGDTVLAMRHHTSPTMALRSTVATAAKMAVRENESESPRKPFPATERAR